MLAALHAAKNCFTTSVLECVYTNYVSKKFNEYKPEKKKTKLIFRMQRKVGKVPDCEIFAVIGSLGSVPNHQ